MTTSCEELTHWKRLWCWEGLGAGGEGDDRGWDGWMASPTRWTWVWVNSGSWWWTGRPGVLWFMGSQRVGHDWVTELNWTLKLGSHCPRETSILIFNLSLQIITFIQNIKLFLWVHLIQIFFLSVPEKVNSLLIDLPDPSLHLFCSSLKTIARLLTLSSW